MDGATWLHRPSPPLDRFVESMWLTLSSVALYRRLRVFPDGHMLLMFNLGADQGVIDERGREQSFRRAWICGSFTRPLEVVAGIDHRILGVRFRPGGARAFLAEDAAELTDRVTELEALWGRVPEEICDRLRGSTPARAFEWVEQTLLARARYDRPQTSLVHAAWHRMVAARGNVRVDELARDIGISRRQLARAFSTDVGLSPKVVARVLRFQSVIERAAANLDDDWGRLVRPCGYYDQSHFTNEFKALSGMTPSAYAEAIKADGEGVITA